MSQKHPIVAVTGSSGAGTSTVKSAFEHIFFREKVNSFIIEGDSFHKYNRQEMKAAVNEAAKLDKKLTHFGPEGNLFERIEELFKQYSQDGTGQRRFYIHSEEEGEKFNQAPGTFTPWTDIPADTDLLFYEGLHGGVVDKDINMAQWVDLLVGVVPIVNLEWIQKIHRDSSERGYSAEAVTDTILRRMDDYVKYITPQFSQSHINFQRVPVVDTSNPFIARDIPTPDESLVVIRFKDPSMVDFPYLLNMIENSFMSRPNTIVVPGGKMGFAMEIILNPLISDLVKNKTKS